MHTSDLMELHLRIEELEAINESEITKEQQDELNTLSIHLEILTSEVE